MSRKITLVFCFSITVLIILITLLSFSVEHANADPTISGALSAHPSDLTQYPSRYTYSNIDKENNYAKQCYIIDQDIQEKLESLQYTIEEPYIIQNPYGNSPLTAYVIFYTDEPCSVTVTVKGKLRSADITRTVNEVTRYHRVPVAGLYPKKNNRVLLTLNDESGTVIGTRKLRIRTEKLPKLVRNAVSVERSREIPSNELTEISGFNTKYPLAFDAQGDIRWYLYGSYDTYGLFPLANGHFLINDGLVCTQNILKPLSQRIMEMDYMGRVYRIYLMNRGVHHDMMEKTPNGNFLVLTNSLENHVEDMVAEIDRDTGEIVKTLDLSEIFGDTYRDMTDWAHLNTISYNEENDCVLISVRNLNCVIKVNWTTNELVWIMGDPETFYGTPFQNKVLTATGDNFRYQYQQHASYEVPEDLDDDPETMQLMLYDNHYINARSVETFDNDMNSYVSIYTINEKEHTVSLYKSYQGKKSIVYSNSLLNMEKRRVYSMGGNRQYYSIYKYPQGVIYEFDYDTGKAVNEYSSKTTFYRGYDFPLDPNTCYKPLKQRKNYVLGTPCTFTKSSTRDTLPDDLLPDDFVTFKIIDHNTLCVWGKNHTIDTIELVSSSSSYRYTQYGINQQQNLFASKVFYTAVDFSDVEYGSYEVVLKYNGIRYRTGKTILISPEKMIELDEEI